MTTITPDQNGKDSRAVVRTAWSVGISAGLYGISFGALSVAAGLSLWQTQVLSLLMFTGGSQFAFISALSGGGAGATAAAALLGVRNGFYGAELNGLLRLPRRWLPVAAQLTIDESTAVAASQDELHLQRRGFWSTGIAVFICWNVTTLIGAISGNLLGDPKRWGLDGAVVAAFVALLWPRLRGGQAWAVAAVAAVVMTVAIPTLPSGLPLLVAGASAAVVALLRHRRRGATPAEGGHS